MSTDTRVFFVVDSTKDNEEIFETLEEAEAYEKTLSHITRLYIAIVRNAYKEDDGGWSYNDRSDTFTIIKQL